MFRRRQNKKAVEEISSSEDLIQNEKMPIDEIDIITPEDSLKNAEKDSNSSSEATESEEAEMEVTSKTRFVPKSAALKLLSTTAGPSRTNILPARPKSAAKKQRSSQSASEDDSDDGVMVSEQPRSRLPGEYDPEKYNDLQVSDEIKDIFQFITKYTPQHLTLDFKYKPFIPDYIPAVGDIDAFLKVVPPEKMLGSEENVNFSNLGLTVLDEPALNQSDSALLHLQFRAISVTSKDNQKLVIKKIDNVDKNYKTIDKWIRDISDLHSSKPPLTVQYSNPMPDIDSLMQEWPPELEILLRTEGFPSHEINASLSEYIDFVCAIFDIPVYNSRIQSLHLLFCLFIAIKNSQLYQLGSDDLEDEEDVNSVYLTDQLILE